MSITSRENRRERVSRGRGEVELPKITRSLPLESLYLERYEWITRSTEYVLLSTPAIEQEQQYLSNEITALNGEYAELLKNINTYSNVKPLKKSRQSNANDKSNQVRDIEIENNNAVLVKLKGESELLYRRLSAVSNGRSEYDCSLIDTREKILKAKQKIKELKLRSKEMGENIESGQDGFTGLKRLEDECNAAETKRGRLEEKLTMSMANFKNLQEKLEEIGTESSLAECWLNEHFNTEKVTEGERSMDQLFKQRTYQLEITKKMIESVRNTKQQKYLQLLRGLEENVEKLKIFDQKLEKLEIRNLYQKKEVIQLQELLAQSMNLKRDRSRTSERSDLNATQLDQILELNQSKKDFNKYQIDLVKEGRYVSSGSTEKLDSRKYYTSRLRTSNIKPILSEQTNKLMSEKERLLSEVRAVNKTEVYDANPIDLEQEINEMTSMMKEALPSSRAIFRTSRTKLKEEVKSKQRPKFEKVEHEFAVAPQERIVQESIQYSPVKQESPVSLEQPQPLLQPLPQPKEQQVNQPEIAEQFLQTVEDQALKIDKNEQKAELQRKRNLISNYVNQFESDSDDVQ